MNLRKLLSARKPETRIRRLRKAIRANLARPDAKQPAQREQRKTLALAIALQRLSQAEQRQNTEGRAS